MISQGETYQHEFSFTQAEVEQFAKISGDNNPLHLDAEFASKTLFKKPIIHGILGASVFSKVLGTQFPGEGTIYIKQNTEFLRPMYVDTVYEALFAVKSIDSTKHTALIETVIKNKESGKLTVKGEATVMNNEQF